MSREEHAGSTDLPPIGAFRGSSLQSGKCGCAGGFRFLHLAAGSQARLLIPRSQVRSLPGPYKIPGNRVFALTPRRRPCRPRPALPPSTATCRCSDSAGQKSSPRSSLRSRGRSTGGSVGEIAETSLHCSSTTCRSGSMATRFGRPRTAMRRPGRCWRRQQRCSGRAQLLADLELEDDLGRTHRNPAVVLVSNNPYSFEPPRAPGTRLALDTGQLGILVLHAPRAGLSPGRAWTATRFSVTAAAPLHAGVDGEAVDLMPPLQFAVRPRALRVRIPSRDVGTRRP